VAVSRIANEVHESERTVRRHLHRLATHGYVALRRHPYGFVITVANSCKFRIWSSGKISQADRLRMPVGSDGSADPTDRIGRCTKEDSAVDSANRRNTPPTPQGGLTSRDRRKLFEEIDRICKARQGSNVDEEELMRLACVRTGTPIEAAKEWVAATLGLEK
jgi:hypothetical protein